MCRVAFYVQKERRFLTQPAAAAAAEDFPAAAEAAEVAPAAAAAADSPIHSPAANCQVM